MAAMNRVGAQVSTAGGVHGHCKWNEESTAPDQFPVGLRVLVVDDDIVCLKIVEKTLRRCRYTVTTCSQATAALKLLRENKGGYDVVLSDVHMPDMDGYKLLEHVGLEMDLPVIMMSADTRTSAVMKGVKHGACDYLIKPIREAELKNIWQHVLRKKWIENKEHEHSGSFEENDWYKRGIDEGDYTSSCNVTTEKIQKKRNTSKEEDDGEAENDDSSTAKKPRVVWSVELHQQFVSAVNQLGIDKAVPKRILELMNVPGLTRENVASHLQKFRLYLKRLSGAAQHSGIPNPFCGVLDSASKLSSIAMAASCQLHPQSLAALHADLLGRPSSGLITPADQATLLQSWPSSSIPITFQTNVIQQPKQFHLQQSINVQPSCLVIPSQSASFQAVNSPIPTNQNFDYSLLPQSLSMEDVKAPGAMWDQSCSFSGNVQQYCVKADEFAEETTMKEMGFAGKFSCIPSRFAVDDIDLLGGGKVKQEPDAFFQQFPASDLMSVFKE